MVFLDEQSVRALNWDQVWHLFRPTSVYGRDGKDALRSNPFRPGDEEGWETAVAQLQSDVEFSRSKYWADAMVRLEEMLGQLPDIRQAVDALRGIQAASGQNSLAIVASQTMPGRQTVPESSTRRGSQSRRQFAASNSGKALTMQALLRVKQFIWSGCACLDEMESRQMDALPLEPRLPRARSNDLHCVGLEWTRPAAWYTLRNLFGADTGPTLTVDELGPTVSEASRRYGEALAAAARQQRDTAEKWVRETGIRPNRDGQLVIPLPSKSDVAEDLKQRPDVTWLRDTPFESVFQVVAAPDEVAAETAAAEAKAMLDAATDEALAEFTAKLAADLDAITQVVADVTSLDLRLAKVRLYQRFSGCVPKRLGDAAARPTRQATVPEDPHANVLEAAVDPLQTYLDPMTWAVASGVHVLGGPNMGGKTMAMRTWAICQALAQYGLPVPAGRMVTRLYDGIRFVEPPATDVSRGLSSFGAEVVGLIEILRLIEASTRVFLCLDEPLRTTNPMEGESLLIRLLDTLHQKSSQSGTVLVTTHYAAPFSLQNLRRFQIGGLRPGILEPTGAPDAALEDRLNRLRHAMDHTIRSVDESETVLWAEKVADILGLLPLLKMSPEEGV